MSGRARVQIRRYGGHAAALLVLAIVGTVCGLFILQGQRLPSPFQSYYPMNAAFPSATAVVAGLGEPVNVAGVRVGQITGTELKDGQAIVHMSIDPSKLPQLYRGAHAALVPNTPLKDMQVDIFPGQRSAGALPHGATIPAGQTLIPIDSDELLDSLDTDTRTWLAGLLTSLGQATAGRGADLHGLLQALGPTSSQLRTLGDLLVGPPPPDLPAGPQLRRPHPGSPHQGRAAAHARAGGRPHDPRVRRSGRGAAARRSRSCPERCRAPARRSPTWSRSRTRSGRPPPRSSPPPASCRRRSATPNTLLQGAALLPLDKIQPFVKASLPVAATLPPLAADLKTEIPELIDAFKVLAYATNETAYNPGDGNQGFLYWLAWFAHNSASFISSSDANGPVWRSLFVSSCQSLKDLPSGPILERVLGTNFHCS